MGQCLLQCCGEGEKQMYRRVILLLVCGIAVSGIEECLVCCCCKLRHVQIGYLEPA